MYVQLFTVHTTFMHFFGHTTFWSQNGLGVTIRRCAPSQCDQWLYPATGGASLIIHVGNNLMSAFTIE